MRISIDAACCAQAGPVEAGVAGQCIRQAPGCRAAHVVSAGAHVSSEEPAIELFGYLRHGLVGRGVMLVGVLILLLNFIDGLTKLAKVNWHVAWQILMSLCYIAVSIRLIQLILAFRGGE